MSKARIVADNGDAVGEVKPFGTAAVKAGYLTCDGSAVSRTTYARLFAAVGTTFGTGDGSTTFNVPDMREVAPVGVGTRGAGAAADVFTLGQFKDDQIGSHVHELRDRGSGATPISTITNLAAGGAERAYSPDGVSSNIIDTSGGIVVGRTGTVTRGKRLGLNFGIRY